MFDEAGSRLHRHGSCLRSDFARLVGGDFVLNFEAENSER